MQCEERTPSATPGLDARESRSLGLDRQVGEAHHVRYAVRCALVPARERPVRAGLGLVESADAQVAETQPDPRDADDARCR
ncbi:hypothetical protein GCM10018952_57730 [Streptosporangium vulgare]